MKELFKNVFYRFNAAGTFANSSPIGSGHIHKTFLIRTLEPDTPDYILQQINLHVFPDVELLMKNIWLVTNHLKKKNLQSYNPRTLEMVQTCEGKNYFRDEAGICWRMFVFISGSRSYDTVNQPSVAYEAGKAFGNFISSLDDFPVQLLNPIIPDFHSLSKRFADFESALTNDSVKRVNNIKPEIKFIFDWIDSMMQLQIRQIQGDFTLRITHNDTKINNVLFNESGKAICVIDLDTVMPGTVLSDFGDAIRTAAANSPEDESDLSKMKIDIDIFRTFSEGFIEKTHSILRPAEIDYLALSCQYITYMQAMRFLTDYLNGDQYYTIHYRNHNLVRARAQIRLAESMKENHAVMQEIVRGLIHGF